jgi:hypothetical protein
MTHESLGVGDFSKVGLCHHGGLSLPEVFSASGNQIRREVGEVHKSTLHITYPMLAGALAVTNELEAFRTAETLLQKTAQVHPAIFSPPTPNHIAFPPTLSSLPFTHAHGMKPTGTGPCPLPTWPPRTFILIGELARSASVARPIARRSHGGHEFIAAGFGHCVDSSVRPLCGHSTRIRRVSHPGLSEDCRWVLALGERANRRAGGDRRTVPG